MRSATIEKTSRDLAVKPNWPDAAFDVSRFSWQAAAGALTGLPGGGLNLAHEAVDRHAAGTRAAHPALRFLERNGSRRETVAAGRPRDREDG